MILDTNALSGWVENDRRLLEALPFDRPLYLPAIVLGEYRFGPKSSRECEIRERWLEQHRTYPEEPTSGTVRSHAPMTNRIELCHVSQPLHLSPHRILFIELLDALRRGCFLIKFREKNFFGAVKNEKRSILSLRSAVRLLLVPA